MRFFISGELDQAVAEEWRSVALDLERTLNGSLQDRDYGPAIKKIALISVIMGPGWSLEIPDRRLFQRKQAAADYRTRIDFEAFRSGSLEKRRRLIVENLINAVADLSRKAGREFDGQRLVGDILRVCGYSPEDVASSNISVRSSAPPGA